jgi:glycosyltransferase involved in cell wall biosynthesis
MSRPPLTLALCSNRPGRIDRSYGEYLQSLGPSDHLLIVLDTEVTDEVRELAEAWCRRATVVRNGANQGLSFSRNVALAYCPTPYLVFVDDDVTISHDVVEAIRQSFAEGAEIVGVRICGPQEGYRLPWYASEGQLHYLGVHPPNGPLRTWGACMGVDVGFARAQGISFRHDLGRRGGTLASGEETTFVSEMKFSGAREVFLDQVHVHHNFDQGRLSARYLFRRAYWQGRTEVRRDNVCGGVRKEWRRYTADAGLSDLRWSLALAYLGAFLFGVVAEVLARRWPRHPRAAPLDCLDRRETFK